MPFSLNPAPETIPSAIAFPSGDQIGGLQMPQQHLAKFTLAATGASETKPGALDWMSPKRTRLGQWSGMTPEVEADWVAQRAKRNEG